MKDSVTLGAYQEQAKRTAIYPHGRSADARLPEVGILYTTLGLAGEAGEVSEKVKKAIREDEAEYLSQARDELGDVLWYWSMLCYELGFDPEAVAAENIEKLADRDARDALTGQGDNR